MQIGLEHSLQNSLDSEFEQQNITKTYNKVSYEDRIHLIEEVQMKKQQIIQVAASLNIKLSTAKYILRSFRKHGKILKKLETKDCDLERFQEKVNFLKAKMEEMNKTKINKKRMKEALEKQKKFINSSKNSTNGLAVCKRDQNQLPNIKLKNILYKSQHIEPGHLQFYYPYPDICFTTMYFYTNPFTFNHLPIDYSQFQ